MVYKFGGISHHWVYDSRVLFLETNGRARDALQTELLIRKYFRKGDVYVHSDLEHSTVVIIKNPSERGVIPPGTLSQAGIMAIATSRAWEVKQGMNFLYPYSKTLLFMN